MGQHAHLDPGAFLAVRSRREDAVKAGGFLTSIPLDVQLEDVERLAKEAMRASGDGKLAAAE